jgi:aspartate beta-hydroxylase
MSIAEPATHPQLLQEARSLLAAGRVDEAAGLFRVLAQADPRHVEARNALAIAALRSGDFAGARAELDAALAVAPDDVLTLNHLAQLQQGEGDVPGALRTYASLLERQPTLYTVRLAYAQLLEATGDAALAARQAFRAIRHAQRAGRWLSAESTAPGLREPVTRAMALVDQHRRDMCERIFAPMLQRFGPEAMARVAGFVAVQLGEASYTPADTRQRPTAMPFPGLPQSPYIDKRRMAGLAELEAETPAILAELHAVLGHDTGREKVFDDPALAREFLRSPRGPASWDGYYFYRHGQRNHTNATRCPRTMAAIDRLALARVPGHGPEVLFSTLGPGTHLMPHHGVTNTRLVCHLPLIVPPDCALSVAGEEHPWRVGEVVVFDDTYSHEALNRSDEVRVVMIFDMWHPDLTEAERIAVCDLQAALGDFAGPTAHGEA